MLWRYGQYKCFNSFSAGIVFIRQNLTSISRRQILTSISRRQILTSIYRRQILTSKVDPHAVRVNDERVELVSTPKLSTIP